MEIRLVTHLATVNLMISGRQWPNMRSKRTRHLKWKSSRIDT